MLSYSIPFSPSSWHQLCDSTKKMWLSCQEMLEIVARKPLLPYSELNNFVGPVEPDLTIRPSILEFVKNRPRASFSSVQECAAIDKLISSPTIRTNSQKVIDQAEQVFTLLMGISEPARKFDLSIIYHPWLRIPPVKLDDPLTFYTTSNEDPWLFNALQAFLVIVTAHPYSDGNGRVSRIVFNSYVRRNCENGFLPIADILRASAGYYEEHLARAAVTGRYDDTVLYLLRLFNGVVA